MKKAYTLIAIVLIVIIAISGGIYWWYQQQKPPTETNTLIVAFASDPSSFDPAVVFDDSIIQMGMIYETLTRVTPKGEVLPWLASSWEVSEDGLEWIFHLREGVKFHDGTEFNASAVKFSFERVLAINKGGAYMLYCIDHMEVVDRYTIKIYLKYPARLDLIVGGVYTTYIVSPSYVKKHATQDDPWAEEWMTEHACGTGPYKLAEWVHGQYVLLEKFDNYWGGWEGKHVEKVIIKAVREATTVETLLKAGEIDVAFYEIPAEKIKEMQESGQFQVLIFPTYHTIYLRINTLKPPCNNVLDRKALCYAFPYDDVIETAYGGFAQRLYGPLPQGMWGSPAPEELPTYEYNLTKAKELLAQAGYPNGGFTIDFYYYSGNEPMRRIAELYADSLSQIGITLNARAFPFDELFPLCVNPDTAPHISAHDWWPSWAADPYDFLYGMFHSDAIGIFNWSFYNNSEVDQLMDEANEISVVNKTKAVELYKEAQTKILEDAVTIYVAQVQRVIILQKWVHGYEFNPNYEYRIDYYAIYKGS